MDSNGLPLPPRGDSDSDNVDSQTITPVGNCWIICRSKSHVGRIYYFNTLSGEAVWNLSNAEIEKAKKRTSSILQNQPETVFESCPEPKEPPTDGNNCRCKKENHQKVYNKQIINNKFTKPQYAVTPVRSSQCLKCSPVNIGTVGMTMPTATSLNPNVWAIPHNSQIFITPASQLVNPNQSTFLNTYDNEQQQVSVQNTSIPLSRRFNYVEEPSFYNRFHHGSPEFSPRYNSNNFKQRKNSPPFYNNYKGTSTSNDLRQRLTERRNFQLNKSYDYQGKEGHHNFRNEYVQNSDQKIQIIKPTAEELFPIEADDSWLKEHAFVEGTQLKLNVEPLKNIAISDVDLHSWFIVADSDAILNHCNLINVIVNSDEQCQLMIPEQTFVEIQTTSRSDDAQLMSRALRVLRFLSQQFTSGHAVMGKESSTNKRSITIVDFTIKLVEQHRNVVLLCQSITRKNECKDNNLHVFTIQEIKDILISTPNKHVLHQPKPQTPPEESLIKITIPNDTQKQLIEKSFRFGTSDETDSNLDVNTEIHTGQTNDDVLKNVEKGTQDIGVQTECYPAIEKPSSSKVLHFENDLDHSLNNNTSNINNTNDNDKALNNISKKREIRLKRNICQQPANSNNNVEKKQFKWRRRKENLSNQNIALEQTKVDVTGSSNDNDQYQDCTEQCVTDENLTSQNWSPNSDSEKATELKVSNDCNFSDTASSGCFNNSGINERVIIEETSTSGVISNTGSNVDSESSSKQNISYVNKEQSLSKCVMFEVESAVMEEHLQTRSDEWLSRFIQIMEEVLTQILQLDSQFYNHILPPPWTLHEATECIKRKFNDDCDIRDATSKLTNILYNISDPRGIINTRLLPIDFMKMYSYGVYLVDSLQARLNDSEDLHTAADSLAKLLADIQNPNCVHNDSFLENIEDPSANDTLSSRANSIQEESNCSITTQGDNNLSKNKPGEENENSIKKYNLRSNRNNKSETNVEETGVKFIRNMDIKSTFFSFLNLKRNENAAISNSISKHLEKKLKLNSNVAVENKDYTEPKIIRQFSKFQEFEERLKNKAREELDLDSLDYSEDEPEEGFGYYEGEYNSESDYYPKEDIENEYEMKGNDDGATKDDEEKNGDLVFKCVIGKIIKEVQEAFTQVSSFCNEVCDELNMSKTLSPERKLQIKERADKAKTHLDRLYESLNSVLYREDAGRENNIKTIMNNAGVLFDCGMVAEYRKIVAKSLEQADVLLESVSIMIDAVK